MFVKSNLVQASHCAVLQIQSHLLGYVDDYVICTPAIAKVQHTLISNYRTLTYSLQHNSTLFTLLPKLMPGDKVDSLQINNNNVTAILGVPSVTDNQYNTIIEMHKIVGCVITLECTPV